MSFDNGAHREETNVRKSPQEQLDPEGRFTVLGFLSSLKCLLELYGKVRTDVESELLVLYSPDRPVIIPA